MAYRSTHGSDHPYARGQFGRRYPEFPAAQTGVSRGTYVATLCAAVLLALWSGASTVYLLFGDDIIHRIAMVQSEATRKQES